VIAAALLLLLLLLLLQAHIGNMEGVPAEKYSQDVMVRQRHTLLVHVAAHMGVAAVPAAL
jgi:hypothetical protein